MARILVYNNNTNRMEKYDRGENDSMPYNKNGTLIFKPASLTTLFGFPN